MIEPVLKAQSLVKRYGRVTALDHCNFELMPGEIIAVIGDNGAGKSTLIKAISGAVVPDSGEVFLEGERVNFSSPLEARERGNAAGADAVEADAGDGGARGGVGAEQVGERRRLAAHEKALLDEGRVGAALRKIAHLLRVRQRGEQVVVGDS